MATAPWLGAATVLLLAVLLRVGGIPAALAALAFAVLSGQAFSLPALSVPEGGRILAVAALPSLQEVERGFAVLVLPQLALTVTNAVILTALLAGDCFGARASDVTPRRLSISSGIGNLVLAPLGAMPMCHGAGGVVAHARFGARTGGAPLMLGGALITLALLPGGAGLGLMAAVPAAGLGALLLVAAVELGASRRLWDCRPSCHPVIAVTAAATVLADPFWGLLAGGAAEALRATIVGAAGRRPGP